MHHQQTRRFIIIVLITALISLSGCTLGVRSIASIPTIDTNATDETKALFMKLWTLAKSNQTLFGHQDDLFFGVGWRDVPGRSDVFEVSGSYPAVYGWEVGAVEFGGPNSGDGVPFDTMREKIIEGYRRGGVITISWHMSNPVTWAMIGTDGSDPTLGTAFDRTPAVSTILPGGSNHALYRRWLDQFAQFDRSLTVSGVPWNDSEHLVPVIFRPFHEHNFSVFWWGGRNTNEADYIALWRFTVEYLRDVAGLHNLLFAYSPDTRGRSCADLETFQTWYFYAYPGDSYVDVLGLDSYSDVELDRLDPYKSCLNMLVQTAQDRSDLKIPALTETGHQRWPDPDWWTTFLYPALVGTRSSGGQVAWALTWRNWDEVNREGPYPGGSDARDFVDFKNKRPILFEDEIPFSLYTWP